MNNELTLEDIRKMEEEIEYSKVFLRKELLVSVKETRAHGDLSENFEYHAAKKEKNKNEARIRYLERMIRSAIIITDMSSEDEIGINNTVKVLFVDDGEKEIYRVVTTVRQNSLKNMISVESPIGKAILGKKVGDQVLVKVNDMASYYLKILEITKTLDESSDILRNY